MRYPGHQAAFFRLLAKILCYLVIGNNNVGYLSKGEWNPYYQVHTGLEVTAPIFSCLVQFRNERCMKV
jgi:hypothetical protein